MLPGAVRLGRDDPDGGHRAGGHEDRHDGQAHRDLVRDHLRARAQAAQQRVRRAGGPAAEHDAVDGHRGAGEQHQHGHRHVGELQRRLVAEDATIGPNGMTESAVNAQIAEITGAKKNTTLSAVFGRMSSLNGHFMPSARVCSRPNGPTWFGPGRTAIRATTRRSNQTPRSVSSSRKTKTTKSLIEDQPPGVVPEVGQRRILRQVDRDHASPPR